MLYLRFIDAVLGGSCVGFVWIRDGGNLKLLKYLYPKHKVMGFRKRFFYWDMGLGFYM
jgi:hypothetical protein